MPPGSRSTSASRTSSSATSAGRTRMPAATSPARSRSCSARRRPATDAEALRELAKEVGLRLRRHGLTGEERLVLVDRGDGMGSMPAAQMAELAGHPRVAVLARRPRGVAGRARERRGRAREDERRPSSRGSRRCRRGPSSPAGSATATSSLLDVRTPAEYGGFGGYPCDPRQGHLPGARHLPVEELFAGAGQPIAPEQVRELVGAARGRRGRRLLPLRLALGARDARIARRGLPGPQLPGLLARMVAPPGAARRARRGERLGAAAPAGAVGRGLDHRSGISRCVRLVSRSYA